MSTTNFYCPNCGGGIKYNLPENFVEDYADIDCPFCQALVSVDLVLKIKLSHEMPDKFEDYKAYKYDSRSR